MTCTATQIIVEIEAGIRRETYSLSVSVERKLNAIYNAYFEYT
jgi:hypothetical protein